MRPRRPPPGEAPRSGLLEAHPTDTVDWQCELQNETDVTLEFGNEVYEAETCNLFGFYFAANRDAPNWTCTFLRAGATEEPSNPLDASGSRGATPRGAGPLRVRAVRQMTSNPRSTTARFFW